jgi:hypothetical protein
MIVYVCYIDYGGYSGYSEPQEVYLSEASAIAWCQANNDSSSTCIGIPSYTELDVQE